MEGVLLTHVTGVIETGEGESSSFVMDIARQWQYRDSIVVFVDSDGVYSTLLPVTINPAMRLSVAFASVSPTVTE